MQEEEEGIARGGKDQEGNRGFPISWQVLKICFSSMQPKRSLTIECRKKSTQYELSTF